MPVEERFAFGLGLVVGIQAFPVKNVQEVRVLGLKIIPTNIQSERNVLVSLSVDGEQFQLKLQFEDETFTDRTFAGKRKTKMEQNNG